MIRQSLTQHWHLRRRNPQLSLTGDFQAPAGWLPATVPGTVQQDLLLQQVIPDPYFGTQETEVQWVGETQWLYQTTFMVEQSTLDQPHVELHFAGLDTICTVFLNGQQLLQSDNMFMSHTLQVKGLLKAGENTLWVHFESPLDVGAERQARHGKRAAWNGNPSRVYVRKAQYHYGWDWGPTLLTAGIWKNVELRAYTSRIEDLHVPAEVSPDLQTAFVPVEVQLQGEGAGHLLSVQLLDPSGQVLHQQEALPGEKVLFQLEQPELWYPSGRGAQPLYTVHAELRREGQLVDQRSVRIGLRRIRVVQERVLGEEGTSFTFEVNNEAFFVGGANWIPEHLLLNTVSDEQYRNRLVQARDANMTMVRVWGGGIYEQDVFYDLCDELGLLVWQDFMFGCGMYPAHDTFKASVKQEAEQQVTRLRNHPCIALWCGNNEDYAIAESVGAAGPDGDLSKFDAREIYEGVLREVCERLDPDTLYWPGSPYGGPESSCQTVGDRHTWEIWHVQMAPYQEYKNYEGRFVSEFGLMSAPALPTVQNSMPAAEWFPESKSFVHHTKAAGPNGQPDGARRLAVYQADNLRGHRNLEEYIYNTQLVQAEAMRYAYRDFRKRFEGPGKYAVSGALVWQLNDCWPVSSWAIIDSSEITKPAYHTIRRELAPLTVGLHLTPAGFEVWISSNQRQCAEATVRLFAHDLHGGLIHQQESQHTVLPARKTALPLWNPGQQPLIGFAELLVDGQVVARASHFPEPYKHFDFADPQLQVHFTGTDTVQLTCQRPAKGVWLETGQKMQWSDNFLDLRPGEVRTVHAPGLGEAHLTVQGLNLAQPITLERMRVEQ